ncbi:IclR family transcriptional regulator [Granulosicoccus sp. 3-233]|uniref:IclR family transcriptional regulator n=1 Tax=Granulosicoccus sp. 3-233 TaxID=3417969 RepID=UPI003D32AA84
MKSSIVEKLLHVLTLVSESKKPRTFSELVADSGLHKSTLHRLLALGLQYGVLQYDEKGKTYLLGPKLFDLVKNAYQGYDIQILALNEMMRLHKLVRQNVTIGVPVGSDTVYLRILEAPQSIGPIPQPGMREPFHCSASGKALMAFRPDSAIKTKLDGHHFEKYTANTITSASKYLKALKEVRKTGFAVNDREEYDHFVGISAPIFNYLSEPIAVLNIWSLHQRCPLSELQGWSTELMASTARVTSLIGGKPPELSTLIGH